jgi:hypothetical protein
MIEIPNKQLLRQDEACLLLDCSRDHLAHLREEGSLEFVNTACKFAVRPNWRVTRDSLVKFYNTRSTIRGNAV